MTFITGTVVRYRDSIGIIEFVCDQYLTVCIKTHGDKFRTVCMLVHTDQWGDIEIIENYTVPIDKLSQPFDQKYFDDI